MTFPLGSVISEFSVVTGGRMEDFVVTMDGSNLFSFTDPVETNGSTVEKSNFHVLGVVVVNALELALKLALELVLVMAFLVVVLGTKPSRSPGM